MDESGSLSESQKSPSILVSEYKNETELKLPTKSKQKRRKSKPRTVNGWNSDLEKVIKGWAEEALALGWMNAKASGKRSKRSTVITSLIGALGIIGGSGAYLNTHCDEILAKVWGSFAIASAALAAVQAGLKDSDRAMEHKTASSEFQAFANEIEYELALSRKSRMECKMFMEKQKKVFNNLVYRTPDVPEDIQEIYKKKFSKAGLSTPDIVDGLHEIYINRRESSESSSM